MCGAKKEQLCNILVPGANYNHIGRSFHFWLIIRRWQDILLQIELKVAVQGPMATSLSLCASLALARARIRLVRLCEVVEKTVRKQRIAGKVEMLKQSHQQRGRAFWSVHEQPASLIIFCLGKHPSIATERLRSGKRLGVITILNRDCCEDICLGCVLW